MKRRNSIKSIGQDTCYTSLGMLFLFAFFFLFSAQIVAQEQSKNMQGIKVKIFFGQKGTSQTQKQVFLKSSIPGFNIAHLIGSSLESNDHVDNKILLNYGAGDVDELIAEIEWRKPTAELLQINKSADMWRYLLEHGSPAQVERLRQDPWNRPDAPLLTIELIEEGTEGFTFSLEHLLKHGGMWLPEHDIFLTDADKPVDFDKHLASFEVDRVLDRIKSEPEASLEQFKGLWKDFGNPLIYDVPWQTKHMGTTGHLIITAAAHGSIYKFAVDRWGNIRPDFASPHRFRIDIGWKESQWKSQKIKNGLPIILTNLERNGQVLEMEQFASPLGEIEAAMRGYIPSVMLTKLKILGKSGPTDFVIGFHDESIGDQVELKENDGGWTVVDNKTGNILLMVEAERGMSVQLSEVESEDNEKQIFLNFTGQLKSKQSMEVIVKLPSPAVDSSQVLRLKAIDFSDAKSRVTSYWQTWLDQGAQFEVPENEVNELFRANLWHALILPRHTIDKHGEPHMDLPYANTAYGQENADWPINQAVYVDYMIYGLRGYEEVAQNEIASMFRTQQQPDGRIGGFANWGVYSPGQLYAIAQNYLLSGNDQLFEQLLPNSLKALDWCLTQIAEARSRENSSGLILGALNDLSHGEREWAFTQAYYVGGLKIFGKALAAYKHPRAEEVLRVAAEMKKDVEREFSQSSVKSSVVQLADGSWMNYVPTDAMTPRRLMDEWYPTDVDTGPLHLARLGALDPYSWLTTAMLNDHEDNLFLDGKGAANEPVYVQQANAYLLRDEPKAVIRSFYSLMACGFSHEQYSPLEHRWAHGQYYGPPSTDGAWFEIYRKMLLNEMGYDTLMIGQAIPRDWLKEGKRIEVKRAPTYFGEVSFSIEGLSSKNEIKATVDLSERKPPKELLVRFRHPDEKPILSVVVNGQVWKDYDEKKEYIRIPDPEGRKYFITAQY
jgi:hypothetical protein